MDATFDHILPLAQSRMPASFGMTILCIQPGNDIYYVLISQANFIETVIKDCMDLNVAEQLC